MPTARDPLGNLLLAGVDLAALLRQTEAGTPSYVYDLDGIADEARQLEVAFEGSPHVVAYAVKANSAGPVIRALCAEGCGADVVSGAELELALACGVEPRRVVYSGVAKLDQELDLAIGYGGCGIGALQIESVEEIARIEARAASLGARARLSVRVNPATPADIIGTHAHISTGHDEAKFGIVREDVGLALEAIASAPHLELVGFSVHIGSQLKRPEPYVSAARDLFTLVRAVRERHGRTLAFVDAGGGFGVDYTGEAPVARPAEYVRAVRGLQRELGLDDLALYVEPGQSLVASHGVLLARVVQEKVMRRAERRWLMIDAGMNDLIRPALYQARHRIVPLGPSPQMAQTLEHAAPTGSVKWRVVGPVCESSDDFGEHELPAAPPELVAILDAGAYGFTMASRYNGRALPAEIFLRDGEPPRVGARAARDSWVSDRARVGDPRVTRPA